MNKPLTGVTRRKLRSSEWFNNPHNPGMTALYRSEEHTSELQSLV